MAKYASSTTVPIERSEVELKRTLRRYDVTDIATFSRPGVASVLFSHHGRTVRFTLDAPPLDSFVQARLQKEYPRSDTWSDWQRTDVTPRAQKDWQQEEKRMWRVLIMVVKAHFELAEEIGFDQAFIAHMVLPQGETVAEYMVPRIDYAQQTGILPDPFADLDPRRRLAAPE